jgi:hypothetical protein
MERFLTVSYKPGDRRWPSLRIQGRWVMISGFRCGDKVKLIIRDREILITNISQSPTAKDPPKVYVQGDLY